MNIITLLTDFGLRTGYVAQMKGVILNIAPNAQCIDITHTIPPQQINLGAYVLSSVSSFYPKGTIHVAVVDPGVGTDRRGIVVVTKNHVFIGPDNGLLIPAANQQGEFIVYEITNHRYMRNQISNTFHGRDIFSPLAAHILKGISFESIGPQIQTYKSLKILKPEISENKIKSSVLFIDDFGNIITNLSTPEFNLKLKNKKNLKVFIKNKEILLPYEGSYGLVEKHKMIITCGSNGLIEIAKNQGNASEELNVAINNEIIFQFD